MPGKAPRDELKKLPDTPKTVLPLRPLESCWPELKMCL